jgi:NAD(P)-dependent dehydrogenase (short-subunit alcohol dehydrogenase family)
MARKRIALVTGSSRGIGRGIALAVARVGYNVAINYRSNKRAAQSVAKAVLQLGRQTITIQADVSVKDERDRMVDDVLEQYGRIDLLVNNAGLAPPKREDILAAGEEVFDKMIEVNLKGPYFLTQRVANIMIRQVREKRSTRPTIVNISSISAYTSSVMRGGYCVAKSGLRMMTKLFADRLAEYGIQVFEVCPGIIETDMTEMVRDKYDNIIPERVPMNRWGKPADVGRAVAAIASGFFTFSTGEVINVDGGFHMHRL